MENIPKISITHDSIEDKSECPGDCDIKGEFTDIEDLDSVDEDQVQVNMIKTLKKTIKKISAEVTDTEVYNDSGSEDDKSQIIPEIKLSLQKFLDQGYTEEQIQLSDKITSRSDCKILEGNFLLTLSIDDPGCITDYESFNTSDDEGINHNPILENEKDVECIQETEKINIVDVISKRDENVLDMEEGACYMSNTINSNDLSENKSEVDIFEISDEEEEYVIAANRTECDSENSFPLIDIKFISEGKPRQKKKPNELHELKNNDECLTDVEKLEESNNSEENSDAEEDQVIPTARASFASLTDIEDIDVAEAIEILNEMQQISELNVPAPTREITIIKVDNSGDPITCVMPLQDNVHLGIYNNYLDKGLTDTEELSGIEEDISDTNISVLKDNNSIHVENIVDNAIVESLESIKATSNKKIDYNDLEPLTDTEEIFLAGTAKRRKNKMKAQNKSKSKHLEVKNLTNPQGTEIEDLDVSDFEIHSKNKRKSEENDSNLPNQPLTLEIKTDIEYISGEEDFVTSEDQKMKINIFHQDNYFCAITSVETLIKKDGEVIQKPSPIVQPIKSNFNITCPQYLTDVEDIQLLSDVEDNSLNEPSSIADTVLPKKLQDILNESCVSVIQEKCGNGFNVDKEKQHIKGIKEYPETHTDIEYLEDDLQISPNKGNCFPEKKRDHLCTLFQLALYPNH